MKGNTAQAELVLATQQKHRFEETEICWGLDETITIFACQNEDCTETHEGSDSVGSVCPLKR